MTAPTLPGIPVTQRTKRPMTESEVMFKIEKLLPGLSQAGLEFISAKIKKLYDSLEAAEVLQRMDSDAPDPT